MRQRAIPGRAMVGAVVLALAAAGGALAPDPGQASRHTLLPMDEKGTSVTGATVTFRPDIGATDSIEVLTGVPGAEYGKSTRSGGTLRILTKRPTGTETTSAATAISEDAFKTFSDLLVGYGEATGTPLSGIDTSWLKTVGERRLGLGSDAIGTFATPSAFGVLLGAHRTSGGYTLVGKATGPSYVVDTDLLTSTGGWPATGLGDRVMVTAGISDEIFSGSVPSTGPGLTLDARYLEPPPCVCAEIDYARVVEDYLTCTEALPRVAFQVRPAQSMASVDMRAQWAFKKLGLPLRLPWERLVPVTVAVIDTGLDVYHPALRPEQLWINPEPGSDARYPQDALGWNFIGNDNNPWDDVGHGTFTAGLVLAVNPRAQIMPLKVLSGLGSGGSPDVIRAILYAVDNGARVINLSLTAKGGSAILQGAVDYARARGVVVVVAAGNEGEDAKQFVPAALRGALTVSATGPDDKKPPFGNWGQPVSLAAPGVDIVSLRAFGSDFVAVATSGVGYTPGSAALGADKWQYRASGTSFSAPFVAGTAALLFSLFPNLTGAQVERMLLHSTDDVDVPGWDQFTGTGRLNVVRAILADPNWALTAKVARVAVAQEAGRNVVQVFGAADGTSFTSYQIQLGRGEAPTGWKTVATVQGAAVADGLLGSFPVREITARGKWSVRVVAQDAAGRTREARGSLDVQ